MSEKLLEIKDLHVHYVSDGETVRAVNGISFYIERGETLGLVGETGAGKSTTALAILNMLPQYVSRVPQGEILVDGDNVLTMKPRELQRLRGSKVSMVFQDPMSSLNPVYRVGDQIAEVLKIHKRAKGKKELREMVGKILEMVGIPAERQDEYPHQFSGGMKQRVIIAIALVCNPKILIADEPTTALDVTIQAQILDLLRSINEKLGTSIILITHDLGVVASMVDTVAVMYCGHIVEKADVRTIFQHPLHPYTEGLLRSIPHMDDSQGDLATIEGSVPSIYHMPEGCAFHNRCACCRKICTQKQPPLLTLDGEHTVQCWKYTPQWDEEGGSDHV